MGNIIFFRKKWTTSENVENKKSQRVLSLALRSKKTSKPVCFSFRADFESSIWGNKKIR